MREILHLSRLEVIPYAMRYREQALEIAREMHRNSTYSDVAMDEEKLVRQLSGPMTVDSSFYFRLCVRGDELYGGFLGHVSKAFFSDCLIARDMGWWVKKEKRGSAAAILLLRDFEAWAKDRGAAKIVVGQVSAIDIEKTTRLYEHCGYRVCGFNTVKDIGEVATRH